MPSTLIRLWPRSPRDIQELFSQRTWQNHAQIKVNNF